MRLGIAVGFAFIVLQWGLAGGFVDVVQVAREQCPAGGLPARAQRGQCRDDPGPQARQVAPVAGIAQRDGQVIHTRADPGPVVEFTTW